MMWLKSFHIISMVAWFAGLFYLPRLFVYHSMTNNLECKNMLKTMESKLFNYIMNPALFSTVFFGMSLLYEYNVFLGLWIYVKISLTFVLVVFHFYLKNIMDTFKRDENKRGHKFYRIINEFPTIILIIIVFLVVFKPF